MQFIKIFSHWLAWFTDSLVEIIIYELLIMNNEPDYYHDNDQLCNSVIECAMRCSIFGWLRLLLLFLCYWLALFGYYSSRDFTRAWQFVHIREHEHCEHHPWTKVITSWLTQTIKSNHWLTVCLFHQAWISQIELNGFTLTSLVTGYFVSLRLCLSGSPISPHSDHSQSSLSV